MRNMQLELGKRLMPAFNSESGLPYSDVNLRTGAAQSPTWVRYPGDVSISEVATLALEFYALSRASGVALFEVCALSLSSSLRIHRAHFCFCFRFRFRFGSGTALAHRTDARVYVCIILIPLKSLQCTVCTMQSTVDRVVAHLHALDKRDGLVPMFVNLHNGQLRRESGIGVGARMDSYYEYLLKYWLLTGRTRTRWPHVPCLAFIAHSTLLPARPGARHVLTDIYSRVTDRCAFGLQPAR